MFRHYLKVAIRQIKKSFLFSSINILGFVLGMVISFLLYLWIVDELTFEDFHKNRDAIFRVVEVSEKSTGEIVETAETFSALAGAFRETFPFVENATFIKYESPESFYYNERLIEAETAYIDSCFFDVFSFPVVEGNVAAFKNTRNQIIITDVIAEKLFGKESAVGKELRSYLYGRSYYHTVAAVVKVPRKSHIQFEVLYPESAFLMPFGWRFKELMHVYVQLNGTTLKQSDRETMSRLLTDKTGSKTMLAFQPLKDIHLKTNFPDGSVHNYGDIGQLWLFGFLSVLILFMGAFNFTTLSMARSTLRYKETGVRKVTGAKRKTLTLQFLSESMVQAFIALLLALTLTEILLPFFNQMVDKDLTFRLNRQVILYIFIGIFVVGTLAGSYPAFYLSYINPLLAFKGGRSTGKKGGFIRMLVSIQFLIAIVLIICTTVIFKQLDYMQKKDLGVEKENIIMIHTKLWYDVNSFKQEVLKHPGVLSVSMANTIGKPDPGFEKFGETVYWYDQNGQTDSLTVNRFWADGDFVETYGIELLQGDWLDDDQSAYWEGTLESSVVINETVRRQMKVDNPVGMYFQSQNGGKGIRISGVVKDFYYEGVKNSVKPLMINYNPEAIGWLHVKISENNKANTLQFLKEKYESINEGKVFSYRFFTDVLKESYAREYQQSRIFFIFTILSLIIAGMGVFGLVALSSQQRTKEIGIRKITGAHTDRIIRMFCIEYLKWVCIAFLVACPVAYLCMVYWLSDFAFRTTLDWWIFLLGGSIVAIVTILTVAFVSYRTASQNPVHSLRYE